MRTLRTVAAILTATARLHTQQRAELDFIFRPEFQKDTPTFLNEIKEGPVVDLLEFF